VTRPGLLRVKLAARRSGFLYVALLGAIEAGLVRTMENAVTVLRQASRPLGPMGVEWLQAQDQLLKRSRQEDGG
jgi:hypothetical protein